MIPRCMTAGYVNRPIIDRSGSTHYSTHWKWFTPKGRKEMSDRT
jgi:hypothetical protein